MNNKTTPMISIIMPVRNAGPFLMEAVNSLINQTYKNWELVAVDDYSSDESYAILERYSLKDNRIKLFRNKKNLGVSGTANMALRKAKGQYIARMDADDISLPRRLEKQLNYLQKNKNIVAVGGQCDVIDKYGQKIGEKLFPTTNQQIKRTIYSRAPVQQPTLFVNRQLLPKNFKWYDDNHDTAEEIEFLFKLFQYGEIHNLNEKVLLYRIHGNNVSLKNPKKTFFLTLKARLKAVLEYGYKPSLLGIIITFSQAVVISILPSKFIYPLYVYLRSGRKDKQAASQLISLEV